ncbi:MAG: transcription initiation factor IIB 3, partial [Halorubrum sp.]
MRDEDADETETDAEEVAGADAGELDPEDFDSEDLTRTADGELIHEETGLIVEEEQIDPGPEWRAFNHSERQSKSRV